MPLTASLMVPSPPRVMSRSSPPASPARRSACPRWVVVTTSRSTSWASARVITSRIPAEVLVAWGLAISRPRGFMRPTLGPYSGAMADPVRPLVAIAAAEAIAAAVLSLLVGLGTSGSDLDVWIAVATVAMWLVIVGALGLIWLGLRRRRRLARTPVPARAGVRPRGGVAPGQLGHRRGPGGGYRPGRGGSGGSGARPAPGSGRGARLIRRAVASFSGPVRPGRCAAGPETWPAAGRRASARRRSARRSGPGSCSRRTACG